MEKKEINIDEIKEKIIDFLKIRRNRWENLSYITSMVRGEIDLPKEDLMELVLSILRKLSENPEIKNIDDNQFMYFEPTYDMSFKDGVFKFSHPERGVATYNINTSETTINGERTYKTLIRYFQGTSVGNTGGEYQVFSDCRKIIREDIRDIGEYGEYICEQIIPHFYKYTRHGYKNFGLILQYLKRFENMYNWRKEGIKTDFVIKESPSILPKNFREMMIENNITLNRMIGDIMSDDIEYFKNLLTILKNEFITQDWWSEMLGSKRLYDLIKDENYDLKATIRYIFNYLIPYEKLRFGSAITLLRDYASINRQLGITDFKRYPKYLKSNHDIINGELELFNKKVDEEKFKRLVRTDLGFKMMKKKDDEEYVEFLIEVPKSSDDVKFEGKVLSHCVGSYIERIIKGETQILFLRKKEGVPLVTLEVRDKVLIQAKGYANRNVNKEEMKYIKQYAKEKELLVRV